MKIYPHIVHEIYHRGWTAQGIAQTSRENMSMNNGVVMLSWQGLLKTAQGGVEVGAEHLENIAALQGNR